jgi:CheY-like chemotaxis protein
VSRLVVEDEAALRALNQRILQRSGYTVLLAADGEEARRICQEHRGRIHVALVEVVLPGSGGRIVADRIVQQRPETRIVHTPGYSDSVPITAAAVRIASTNQILSNTTFNVFINSGTSAAADADFTFIVTGR